MSTDGTDDEIHVLSRNGDSTVDAFGSRTYIHGVNVPLGKKSLGECDFCAYQNDPDAFPNVKVIDREKGFLRFPTNHPWANMSNGDVQDILIGQHEPNMFDWEPTLQTQFWYTYLRLLILESYTGVSRSSGTSAGMLQQRTGTEIHPHAHIYGLSGGIPQNGKNNLRAHGDRDPIFFSASDVVAYCPIDSKSPFEFIIEVNFPRGRLGADLAAHSEELMECARLVAHVWSSCHHVMRDIAVRVQSDPAAANIFLPLPEIEMEQCMPAVTTLTVGDEGIRMRSRTHPDRILREGRPNALEDLGISVIRVSPQDAARSFEHCNLSL